MNSKIRWALLGVAALLSACGGGGGGAETLDASSSKVTGRVVKGPVAQAQVTAVAVSPFTAAPVSEEISLGETGVNGGFSGDLSQLPLDRPVLIRSFGGSFIDESDPDSDGTGRRQIQVDSESGLFVYRPPGVENVSLTLLTDAMSVRALEIAQQQQISVANAFDAVREQAVSVFGFDPLTTRAVDPISPGDASNDERQYALIIGSLAVVANEVSVRLGRGQMDTEIISAVLDDLSDGAVDGRRGDSPISIGGEPMPDIDWQAAIQRFRNDNDGAYKNVAPPQPNESDWAEVPPPSNAAPTIVPLDTPLFIGQGASITIDTALLQASDAETDTTNLKFVLINPPELGQISFGEVALEPEHDPVDFLVYTNLEAGAQGLTDNVTFAVVDEDGGAVFANVSVQINQLPEPEDDATDIDEDGALTLGVLGNDSDPDGQALEIVGLTPVSQEGSQLTVAGPGQVQILPPQNFFGEISFNYTVSDGFDEADANVQITVNPVNDPPIATDDFITTDEDVAITISPLLNDTDVDDGDTLSIVANTLTAQNGSASLNGTEVTFTPSPDFNGDATLTYEVTDGSATDTGVVTVTVNPLNDAPAVQGGIANQNATEEQPFTFAFSDTTFSDVDGDTLSYTATEVDSMGLPQWLTFNAVARTFSGTPDDLDLPSADIQVTADDGNGGSASTVFTISIAPVNDAPEISAQQPLSTNEDTTLSLSLANFTASDAEGDNLSLVVLEGDNYGFNGNDVTPAADFNGVLTVPVVVNDGQIDSAVFNASVTVNPINDAPEITAQQPLSTDEDTALTLSLADFTTSDIENDALSLQVLEGDNYSFNGNQITPSADFNGTLTVPVVVNDGQVDSAIFNAAVTVDAVNDAPQITAQQALATDEDTPLTLSLTNFTTNDVEGDPLTLVVQAGNDYSVSANQITPALDFNGMLTVPVLVNDGQVDSAVFNASVTVSPINDAPEITAQQPLSTNEDTALTLSLADFTTSDVENDTLSLQVLEGDNYSFTGNQITPSPDFNGTLTVPVVVNDGQTDSEVFNASVTVNAVNDAPTLDAIGDPAAIDEDAAEQTISLSGISAGGGESQTLTVTAVSDNTALIPNPAVTYTSPQTSGSLSFTPVADQNGVAVITVTVDDGGATDNTVVSTFTVTVNAVNDTPTLDAISNPAAIDEDAGEQTVGLTGMTAGGSESQTLVVTATSDNTALIATVSVTYTSPDTTGSVRFTPVPDQDGTAVITVTVNDGGEVNNLVSRTFTVTVNSVLDETVFVSPTGSDTPSCGFDIASACLSIRQGVTQASLESQQHANAEVLVLVEGGTYSVDGGDDASAVILQPNVSISGGWDSAFALQDVQSNATILESIGTGDGVFPAVPAPLRCPSNITDITFVEGLRVLGSTAQSETGTAAALRLEGSCAANFHKNIFNARGGITQDSMAVLVGDGGNGPHPAAIFTNNLIYGGSAGGLAAAVYANGSHGTAFNGNYIEGGISSGLQGHALLLSAGSDSASSPGANEVISVENNVIAARDDVVRVGDSGAAKAAIVNNTIYGQDQAVVAGHPNAEADLFNNLIVTGTLQTPGVVCINKDNNTAAWQLEHNAASNCATEFTEAQGGGAVEVNNTTLALAEELVFADGLQIDYAQSIGLFDVQNNGADLVLLQEFDLDPISSCVALMGGLGTPAPSDDIFGNERLRVHHGECVFGDLAATFGDGITIGAVEYERAARYVSAAGNDSEVDCTVRTAPCATLGRALSEAQEDDEIRVAVGSYQASAGSNETFPARITKVLNVIGGYNANFEEVPVCEPGLCNTQIDLLDAATGDDRQTTLLCDGTNFGQSENLVLIAGLALAADDTTDADDVTRALVLRERCDAIVTSNLISGGNGGVNGSQMSEGIQIGAAGGLETFPTIVGNSISGGAGSTTVTYGISVLPGHSPFIQNNEIVGNTDTDPAAPNATQSRAVMLGSEGAGATGQGGFGITVLDGNYLDGGLAENNTKALFLNGYGETQVFRNELYGGVAVASDGDTMGLSALTDNSVSIFNNLIHGGIATALDGGFAHGVRLATLATNAGEMRVINNTIWSGYPGDQGSGSAMGLVYTNLNGFQASVFDATNNIIGAAVAGQSVDSVCITEEVEINPSAINNNDLYGCSTLYRDIVEGTPADYISLSELHASGNNAADNVSVDPLFADFDGPDNDPATPDGDLTLTAFSPCGVVAGGSSSVASQEPFVSDDFELVLRTPDQGNPGFGFSMGAYELDDPRCDSGQANP